MFYVYGEEIIEQYYDNYWSHIAVNLNHINHTLLW